jgi:xanthine dehydrogenase/oxidase
MVPLDTTLNEFLRRHAHLTGTKFMCLEGGCGACIVTVRKLNPVSKKVETLAVNSCLVLVFQCHGWDILTVEGIGDKVKGYNPVQSRLAEFNGSQCGYCSPGMVMNMYSLLANQEGQVTMDQVENSFAGNICRCTGYRPILDAFKSLAVDADGQLKDRVTDIEDLSQLFAKNDQLQAEKKVESTPVHLQFEDGRHWFKVFTLSELFTVLENRQTKPYILVGGNTGHGVYRRPDDLEIFVDISDVPELHVCQATDEHLIIGGGVPLNEVMAFLKGAPEKEPNFAYCKELVEHIDLVAHIPVRNIGSLAGNLAIKHRHHEFPSDIFLLLETCGATVTICE